MYEFSSAVSPNLFQFLIGRLKTVFSVLYGSSSILFQFLIGRLKTTYLCCQAMLANMFQFLIGRLKTSVDIQVTATIGGFNSL